MTKRNIEKLLVLQSIIAWATNSVNQSITNLILAFKNGITTIGSIVQQVNAVSGSQNLPVAGGGSQKQFYRTALNQITYAILNASKGYLIFIKNLDEAKKFEFSQTKIDAISNKDISSMCTAWHKKVLSFMPGVKDFGISQSSCDAWLAAIDSYNTSYLLPVQNKKTKTNQTRMINEMIEQAWQTRKDACDTSVTSFTQMGHTGFVNEYKDYCKISHVATRHTKFRAFVNDDAGNPIPQALVFINNSDGSQFKGNTDIDGRCTIEKVKFGIHTATITVGTKSVTTPQMLFKKGETISRSFTMQPAGFAMSEPVENQIPLKAQ